MPDDPEAASATAPTLLQNSYSDSLLFSQGKIDFLVLGPKAVLGPVLPPGSGRAGDWMIPAQHPNKGCM
jgi:hypothetical protein